MADQELPLAEPTNNETQSSDIAKIVRELLSRSKKSSADERKKIVDNYQFFVNGKQWDIDRPAWRFKEIINISLGTMLQEVGIQTDSRPKFEYSPQEPMDVAFTDVLKELNDRNWSKTDVQGFGWPNKLEQHVFEVKYSPWSWAEICWDPTLEPPLGDIGWRKLDPTYCFWDPLAKSIYDLRWFIYIEPTPTEKLKAQYPDKADEIKPDVGPVTPGMDRQDYNVDRDWLASMIEQDGAPTMHDDNQYGGEPITLKIRAWTRDTTVMEVANEKQMEDGTVQPVIERKLKYPKGRYVELAGNTVLCDHENGVMINGEVHPYEDGLFPVALLRNYTIPGQIIGIPEAPFLKGPQKIANYVWSFWLDSMKMSSNPKVTLSQGAVELADMITNEPGAVFEVPTQDSIKFHPGDPVPSSTANAMEMAMQLIDKIQGIGETSKGSPQPGVTSGIMLEGFVEAAQTRPRLKNRNVDQFLGQVGFLVLSRMFQFYTAARVIRISNKQDGWPEHIQFFFETDAKGQKYARITPMAVGGGGGAVPGPTRSVPVAGMPDVNVISGSALPYGRAQKQAMATEQYKMGAIDLETYLTDVGRTDVQQIMERMQAQKEQEAAMQPPPGGKA